MKRKEKDERGDGGKCLEKRNNITNKEHNRAARLTAIELAMQKHREKNISTNNGGIEYKSTMKQKALEGVPIDLYKWSNEMKRKQDKINIVNLAKHTKEKNAKVNPTAAMEIDGVHIELTTVEDIEALTRKDYCYIVMQAIFYHVLSIGAFICIQISVKGVESFSTPKAEKSTFAFFIAYMSVSGIAMINWFAKTPTKSTDNLEGGYLGGRVDSSEATNHHAGQNIVRKAKIFLIGSFVLFAIVIFITPNIEVKKYTTGKCSKNPYFDGVCQSPDIYYFRKNSSLNQQIQKYNIPDSRTSALIASMYILLKDSSIDKDRYPNCVKNMIQYSCSLMFSPCATRNCQPLTKCTRPCKSLVAQCPDLMSISFWGRNYKDDFDFLRQVIISLFGKEEGQFLLTILDSMNTCSQSHGGGEENHNNDDENCDIHYEFVSGSHRCNAKSTTDNHDDSDVMVDHVFLEQLTIVATCVIFVCYLFIVILFPHYNIFLYKRRGVKYCAFFITYITGMIVFQAGVVYRTIEVVPYFAIAIACVYVSLNVFAVDVDNLRDEDVKYKGDINTLSPNNMEGTLMNCMSHKFNAFLAKHKTIVTLILKVKNEFFSSSGKYFFYKVVILEVFEVVVQISGMMHNSNEVSIEITLATTAAVCLNTILMPVFILLVYNYCGKKIALAGFLTTEIIIDKLYISIALYILFRDVSIYNIRPNKNIFEHAALLVPAFMTFVDVRDILVIGSVKEQNNFKLNKHSTRSFRERKLQKMIEYGRLPKMIKFIGFTFCLVGIALLTHILLVNHNMSTECGAHVGILLQCMNPKIYFQNGFFGAPACNFNEVKRFDCSNMNIDNSKVKLLQESEDENTLWKNFTSLHTVDFSYNQNLKYLPNSMANNLYNLTSVDISHTGVNTIPFGLAKLKQPDGSNNKIKIFKTSDSPANYQIDWSNIGLKSSDMTLSNAFRTQMSESIQIINVSSNELESTPLFLKEMKKKITFDISSNNLKIISSSDGLQEFYRNPRTYINISNNPIESIWLKNEYRFQLENQINPKYLKRVEVHNYPALRKIPNYVSSESNNIETLVLKGIHLGTRVEITSDTLIDEDIKTKLLSRNKKSSQTYGIQFGNFLQQHRLCHLKKLKLLDLSSNGLGELPECLKNLTELHTFQAQINTFPITRYCNGTKGAEFYDLTVLKTVLSIPNLQYLDMSVNELGKLQPEKENEVLKEYLPKLTTLKHLKMDYNYLGKATIPDLSGLKHLNTLKIYPMYNGDFNRLPESICNLNFTTKNNCNIGPKGGNISCHSNKRLLCITDKVNKTKIRWPDEANDVDCLINASFYKLEMEKYGGG